MVEKLHFEELPFVFDDIQREHKIQLPNLGKHYIWIDVDNIVLYN